MLTISAGQLRHELLICTNLTVPLSSQDSSVCHTHVSLLKPCSISSGILLVFFSSLLSSVGFRSLCMQICVALDTQLLNIASSAKIHASWNSPI